MATERPGIRLRVLLLGVTLALLVGAVGVVAATAVAGLEGAAAANGRARAALAAVAAERAVAALGRDLDATARLLAERPTLARLLGEVASGRQAAPALVAFLERFRATSGLATVAVHDPQSPNGPRSTGEPLEMVAAPERWPARGSVTLAGPDGVDLVAVARLGGDGSTRPPAAVLVARRLDAELVARLGQQLGVELRLSPGAPPATREVPDPWHLAATTMAPPADGDGDFAATALLTDQDGTTVATLTALAPRRDAAALVRDFEAHTLRTALLVAAVASLLAVLAASLLERPVRALTAAAERIGAGDFATAVPPAPGQELATLARSMDTMRRRLQSLTSELRLRDSESSAVLAGIADGVFAVDGERRLRFLNPAAAALLGVDGKAAQGRFCGDVLAPRRADGSRPCDDDCQILHARSRGSTRAVEQLVLADGARRTVVITSAPPAHVPAGDGAPGVSSAAAGQIQVLRDETELESERRLRDTVLANLSHEFRTPLAAQLASLELLGDRLANAAAPDDEASELVSVLHRGNLRLTHLIDNLLESVRIEAGEDRLRRSRVELDAVVEAAVEMTHPLLAQKRQQLEVALPYPLPALTGDPTRLTQVFVNLLANANKFAPDGSRIRVGGQLGPRSVELWVADDGPGLPANAGERLLRPFVRGPGGEPSQGGVGLGLAIVDSIVRRHGGRVTLASPAPSGRESNGIAGDRPDGAPGTRVTITLPLPGSDEVAA